VDAEPNPQVLESCYSRSPALISLLCADLVTFAGGHPDRFGVFNRRENENRLH